MSLNTRIKERREQLNLSRIELAEKIGVTPSAIANYENAVSSPKIELMYKLFDALNCDANFLYQDEMNALTYKDKATPEEFERIIKKYRNLDDYGKETVDITLNREAKRVRQLRDLDEQVAKLQTCPAAVIDLQPYPGTRYLTEYFRSASAGGGVFIFGNEAPAKILVSESDWDSRVDYVVSISGDSMEPDYMDGDKVMVSQHVEIHHGDVGIFVVDGKAYIKEYGEQELISRNHKRPNIKISEYSNIVCMGKVIGKINGPFKIIND